MFKDMYDDIRSIQQDPAALPSALDMVHPHAVLFQPVLDVVGKRKSLPLIGRAGDDNFIYRRIERRIRLDKDVLSLLFTDRLQYDFQFFFH